MAHENDLPKDLGPIPSPYNFVPLSKHVFFPGWGKQVSMDVPFSDGISGTLQIKVTAKTPIYIRNGGAHPEGQARLNDANYSDFFQVTPGGPYAIPGSSLKGMLRNVIEVASFGKIAGTRGSASRVSNHRYAVRDLQNPHLYGDHITEAVGGAYKPKVKAAWLSRTPGGQWQIVLCDFARVEQEDLEAWRGINCSIGGSGPARRKYESIPPLTQVPFDCGPEEPHDHSLEKRLIYKKAANLGKGQTVGTLVMTGQPSTRNGSPGRKHMEFIFFGVPQGPIPVPDAVKQDFEFAHSELGENRKPNTEWAFWKPKLNTANGCVPVFVLFRKGTLHSMGLAMMYRFPYEHSMHQTIEHTSKDHLDGDRLDLAELIFGRVEEQDGLRGRVAVETLLADDDPRVVEPVTAVLNAPKPTYYPNYVKQPTDASDDLGTVKSNYRTYMDGSAVIRGWKRYIVRPSSEVSAPPATAEQARVATRFRPLPAGTTFTGLLHLHNLRPQEFGALAWAITWGGSRSLRHSLGMAKPYGYGSVTVDIVGAELRRCNPEGSCPLELAACQKVFTDTMDAWVKEAGAAKSWSLSDAIRALKAMANPGMDWPQEVRYPRLGDGPKTNEFVLHRKPGVQHSLIDPLTVKPRQAPPQARPAPAAAPPLSLAAGIAAEAAAMKDKYLRKALADLTQVSQAEYDEILRATRKRPDASNRYLQGPVDWPTALKELANRVQG